MKPAPPSHVLIALPRPGKRVLALLLDCLLAALAVWLAWCLRRDQWIAWSPQHSWATAAAWALGLPIFMRFGLYASIFRYAGWNAMLALIQAFSWYGLLYASLFTVIGIPGVPRSMGILQPLLMFVLLGLSRLLVRLWLGDLYRDLLQKMKAPGVLIYGAGAAGRQLAASLMRMNSQRLVGFMDDDPALQGRLLDGVKVYASAALPTLIARQGVHDVLLAMPSASHQQRKAILEQLRPHPVYVRTLPGLDVLVSQGISPSDLQELDIEDLLGRDPVAPDAALMQGHLQGKTVLVTGAGGSIGSELCRQILQWRPHRLLLLEHSEFALYDIHAELSAQAKVLAGTDASAISILPLQGSVQDAARLHEVLSAWPVDTLYHAAAYKHVPLVEHNPVQGLRNNVWGTLTCALAAAQCGVPHFVLISTDKAVRPTNVMGASKRLAEMTLQALAAQGSGTCFTMVRFGNVLGSSGSVVPLFRRQIAAGGPITLTHQDITRYFMTIPEAAQLVIQAGTMARGGEVFVLDMGEPVRIYDLAQRMIELTGKRVRPAVAAADNADGIAIEITGLRPGEKLYEELLIDANTQATQHPRILQAQEQFLPWPQLQQALAQLDAHMQQAEHSAIRALLQQLVSGYQPTDPLVDWALQARQTAAGSTPPDAAPPAAASAARASIQTVTAL